MGRHNAELVTRWRGRAQVQAYRLEQRLASFFTTPEQDAYLLSKTGPAALSAIPRQIVTFRMLRKRALQVRARPALSSQSVRVLFRKATHLQALPYERAARDAGNACELRTSVTSCLGISAAGHGGGDQGARRQGPGRRQGLGVGSGLT